MSTQVTFLEPSDNVSLSKFDFWQIFFRISEDQCHSKWRLTILKAFVWFIIVNFLPWKGMQKDDPLQSTKSTVQLSVDSRLLVDDCSHCVWKFFFFYVKQCCLFIYYSIIFVFKLDNRDRSSKIKNSLIYGFLPVILNSKQNKEFKYLKIWGLSFIWVKNFFCVI